MTYMRLIDRYLVNIANGTKQVFYEQLQIAPLTSLVQHNFAVGMVFCFYLLTQTGITWAAVQLMWTFGITACALTATSEYLFTDLGEMDSWVVA